MNSVEILEGAIETIKSGWTQGQLAVDSDGKEVDPTSSAAVQWCILGSLRKAAQIDGDTWKDIAASSKYFPAWAQAKETLYNILGGPLSDWNDEEYRTREDILQLLEKARDKEESK